MNEYLAENFSDKEFVLMMFNVVELPPQKHVIHAFPKLKKVREFTKPLAKLNKNKVLRYVMFLYDKNSPFRAKFQDVLQRKVEAAKGAGWETVEGGIFADDVERILRGHNITVNEMIVAFIRLHRNFKYSYLVGLEESFYRMMLEIMTGEMGNVSKMKQTQEELEIIMLELTSEDNNPELRDTLLRYVEQARLNLRPEDIARIAKQRESEQEV